MATLLLASAVALLLGIVAARLMRVLGLVLVLAVVIAGGIAGLVTDLPHPTLLETVVLMVLVQAGYLVGVLGLGARKPARPDTAALTPRTDRTAG